MKKTPESKPTETAIFANDAKHRKSYLASVARLEELGGGRGTIAPPARAV
jgi:hypothetical protein